MRPPNVIALFGPRSRLVSSHFAPPPLRLALSLLDEMRSVGLRPDHVTYGSAVSAMAKAGHWERALSLLRQMLEEGLRPNVVCYGAAVDACAKGGKWERAVGLLEEMRQAGVEPDRYVVH